MSRSSYLRFRQPGALLVAALIATVAVLPAAGSRWYLAPLLIVPVLVLAWAWRSGTDVGRSGFRVRALLGSRLVPWSDVAELSADRRGRVSALLTDGKVLRMTGVTAQDLPVVIDTAGRGAREPTVP